MNLVQQRLYLGIAMTLLSGIAHASPAQKRSIAQDTVQETQIPEGQTTAPAANNQVPTGVAKPSNLTPKSAPANSNQQPNAVPVPQQNVEPPREIERQEPIQTPVAASAKSQTQLEYEANMQIRFDGFAKTIKELEVKLETLDKKMQLSAVKTLRTAQGNRSVARTKLKQLRFIAPAQWTSVQAGIERAMKDLETAVKRAEAAMNP